MGLVEENGIFMVDVKIDYLNIITFSKNIGIINLSRLDYISE